MSVLDHGRCPSASNCAWGTATACRRLFQGKALTRVAPFVLSVCTGLAVASEADVAGEPTHGAGSAQSAPSRAVTPVLGLLNALEWAVVAGEALLPWLVADAESPAESPQGQASSAQRVAEANVPTAAPAAGVAPPKAHGNGNGRGNGDVYDPDAPPATRNRIAESWWWGGDIEVKYEVEDNFNLDDDDPDKLETIKPEIEVALFYKSSPAYDAFFNFGLSRQYALTEESGDRDRDAKLKVKRAYIRFKQALPGTETIIGRQRIKDQREWYYDEVLDGVRVVADFGRAELDGSFSREDLVDGDLLNDVESDRINNFFLTLRFSDALPELDLSGYFVVRDDRSEEEGTPYWLGVRALGKASDRLRYWGDVAYVGGDPGVDNDQPNADDLSGYGFDVGATYVLEQKLEPSFTVSYAFGSGDSDPDDGTDRNFRQTGLQDNNARFNGVTRFKYYGELFDPELSNLKIFTAAFGVRPSASTSVDVLYHRYSQDEAFDELRDVGIDEDPDGDRRSLGDELDLVFGLRGWHDINLEFITGYFKPGGAFEEGADDALFVNFEARYRF